MTLSPVIDLTNIFSDKSWGPWEELDDRYDTDSELCEEYTEVRRLFVCHYDVVKDAALRQPFDSNTASDVWEHVDDYIGEWEEELSCALDSLEEYCGMELYEGNYFIFQYR
jgi:hypothetical protein